jgi:hypothetical protein
MRDVRRPRGSIIRALGWLRARDHIVGHAIGSIPPGERHESVRTGSLRRRILKLVYAPITPSSVTLSSILAFA